MGHETSQPPAAPTRRSFFWWLTAGLSAVAAAVVGIPFVGYLIGARKRRTDLWVKLGPVSEFPVEETRLKTFENPLRQPWDGMTANTGVYVRRLDGAGLALKVAPEGEGLGVVRITEGSSADEAGLRTGDVLTALDGKPLTDPAAFVSDLAARKPGEVVRLRLKREGREKELRVRLDPRFQVLAVNCAHLGCPVTWFPQSGLFMCPCHGGVYYADGSHASGPPPRGLFQCVWRVADDKLQVRPPHYPTLQDPLSPDDKAEG